MGSSSSSQRKNSNQTGSNNFLSATNPLGGRNASRTRSISSARSIPPFADGSPTTMNSSGIGAGLGASQYMSSRRDQASSNMGSSFLRSNSRENNRSMTKGGRSASRGVDPISPDSKKRSSRWIGQPSFGGPQEQTSFVRNDDYKSNDYIVSAKGNQSLVRTFSGQQQTMTSPIEELEKQRGQKRKSVNTDTLNGGQIKKITNALLDGLNIEDKSYTVYLNNGMKFQQFFTQCFEGCEAVDFLVTRALAPNEKVAVDIGRTLARLKIIEHVNQDYDFENRPYYYRFQPQALQILNGLGDDVPVHIIESQTNNLSGSTQGSSGGSPMDFMSPKNQRRMMVSNAAEKYQMQVAGKSGKPQGNRPQNVPVESPQTVDQYLVL